MTEIEKMWWENEFLHVKDNKLYIGDREAKTIAEEICCPEILWKVYFEYGKFLQYNKVYAKALEYYEKCHKIFIDVGSKIKNESYRHSYLDHPNRQAVFSAVHEIKKLIKLG